MSIYRSDHEDNNKEHHHEFEEFVIVTGGRGFHIIDGEPYFIKKGDIFFVKKGTNHFYDEIDDLRLINILVNPNQPFRHLSDEDKLLQKFEIKSGCHFYWLNDIYVNRALAMIDEMFEADMTSTEDIDFIQESLFYRLVVFVITSQNKIHSDSLFRIHSLLKKIESNCYETISWEFAAKEANLSPRTLYRHIKSVTGMSPDGFIRRLRLISARNLLRTSDETITSIAIKCGFSSSSHFTSCYRAIFNKTPSEERSHIGI